MFTKCPPMLGPDQVPQNNAQVDTSIVLITEMGKTAQ